LGRGCLLGKHVPGDGQHVHCFLLAEFRHSLDPAAKVFGAVLTAQTVIQVPIGGME
jgi:hypothetical protein